MAFNEVVSLAKEFMRDARMSGWLIYDYKGMNPIFKEVIGPVDNLTRPSWLWIPADGDPSLLTSFVDSGRFPDLMVTHHNFVSRQDMIEQLSGLISDASEIAMEYSPQGELPKVSTVDGGTIEFVRSLGVDIVSSADLIQYATHRWDKAELQSHQHAANVLTTVVKQAFSRIQANLHIGITEYEVADFIRERLKNENMYVADGPVVAVNAHSADPHFEPTRKHTDLFKEGDWVLIDLWARESSDRGMFADITWTAYVGSKVPLEHLEVFNVVIDARDRALDFINESCSSQRDVAGWEVDSIARKYIDERGYGAYFGHRLGHSLGREVHSNAVNLDSWETNDTRRLLSGIAVTIEPGIYLPGKFGVRSEINVFMTENGPLLTTEKQTEPFIIPI